MLYSRHANMDASMQELQANLASGRPMADENSKHVVSETKRLVKMARPDRPAPSDAEIEQILSKMIKLHHPQGLGGGLVQDISGEIGNMAEHARPLLGTVAHFLI